jgi:hypothetical protein
MDGVHDLGGMQGFGPVEREVDEPVFHAAWEAAVVAMMRAGGGRGVYNIDEFPSRHRTDEPQPLPAGHLLRESGSTGSPASSWKRAW